MAVRSSVRGRCLSGIAGVMFPAALAVSRHLIASARAIRRTVGGLRWPSNPCTACRLVNDARQFRGRNAAGPALHLLRKARSASPPCRRSALCMRTRDAGFRRGLGRPGMNILSPSRKNRATLILWLMEIGLLLLAGAIAIRLRFLHNPLGEEIFIRDGLVRMVVVAALLTVAMAAFGLYQVHVRHNRDGPGVAAGAVLRVRRHRVAGALLPGAADLHRPRRAGDGAGALAASGSLRCACLPSMCSRADVFKRRVLVLGAGNNADLINGRLRRRTTGARSRWSVSCRCRDSRSWCRKRCRSVPTSTCRSWRNGCSVHEIVVAPDERRGGLPMEEMLKCAQRGIPVTDLSTFFEREAGMISSTWPIRRGWCFPAGSTIRCRAA